MSAVLVAFLIVGLPFGQPMVFMLLGAAFYLAWHLRNIYRLYVWLRRGRRFHPPESSGIWEEIFQQIYRLQQRNRKRKRKLGNMLSRFQQATKALPDATVVLAGHGEEVEWWNVAAGQLLGLVNPRDVGQRISNLVRHPVFISYLLREDYTEPVEFPAPVDENLLLSVRIIAYGKDQRLVVARDITRLKRLEQTRRDFVANASHELRTPLTVISGYLETLADDPEAHTGPWLRTLPILQEQSLSMQHLVDDLLLLSRLETEHPEEQGEGVNVPALLAAILEDARSLSGDAAHDIQLEAEPDLWLQGRELELRSAFSNLAYNAVRYTPPGGRIDLRWYSDDEGAHYAVTDTGIGIAPQHLPRLTERFYRVDVGRSRNSGGTGLGLAIVKHVLLRHDARLSVDSEPGAGSCFYCDFPPAAVIRHDACA